MVRCSRRLLFHGSHPLCFQARPVASTPHLIWAGGHVVTLLSGAWALKSLLFLWRWSAPSESYKVAYAGALVSYAIVVYKSIGVPTLSRSYLQRMALDENVQYLILSLYWFTTTVIPITLVPYVVFSLFHVLTFIRTTLIPLAFPAPAGTNTVPKQLGTKIQTWVKANYDPAMRIVAYAELVIFLRVLVGAVFLRNSFLTPIFFVHFLRLRFYLSSFSRLAILHVTDILDTKTQDPRCPPVIRKTFLSGRQLVAQYASRIVPTQPHGPAPPTTASATATPAAATATATGTAPAA